MYNCGQWCLWCLWYMLFVSGRVMFVAHGVGDIGLPCGVCGTWCL